MDVPVATDPVADDRLSDERRTAFDSAKSAAERPGLGPLRRSDERLVRRLSYAKRLSAVAQSLQFRD